MKCGYSSVVSNNMYYVFPREKSKTIELWDTKFGTRGGLDALWYGTSFGSVRSKVKVTELGSVLSACL